MMTVSLPGPSMFMGRGCHATMLLLVPLGHRFLHQAEAELAVAFAVGKQRLPRSGVADRDRDEVIDDLLCPLSARHVPHDELAWLLPVADNALQILAPFPSFACGFIVMLA